MTHDTHSEDALDAPINIFLDKIAARFITASDALANVADALDGRSHVTVAALDDVRRVAASVARSMDAVDAICRHFESALLTPGGMDENARQARTAIQELHARGLVAGALAGEVRS